MEIIDIKYIRDTGLDEYVYDLETDDGTYYAGSDIILKNTDSCYVKFDLDKTKFLTETGSLDEVAYMREYFRISQECADKITETFKKPIKLEFEKVMYPFFLYMKKRYAFKMYTVPEHAEEELEYKGISMIRRDFCPLVKEVCSSIFEILMNSAEGTESINNAIDYTKSILDDLFNNKIPLNKLVISKSLKNRYKVDGIEVLWYKGLCKLHKKEKEQGHICKGCDNCKCKICKKSDLDINCKNCKECKQCKDSFNCVKAPHVAIAKKLRLINPAAAPKPPDRIPYVFIVNKNAKHQCDQVEHIDYITSKIDTLYYFEHQIKNSIYQIFHLMIEDKTEDIYSDIVREKENKDNNQKSIDSFFKNKNKDTILKNITRLENELDYDTDN